MDANRSGNDYRWTNDKHLHFLKSVEATFVRTILEEGAARFHRLELDRNLPDSCESTLDSKPKSCIKRRNKHFSSDNLDTSKRVRRLHLHTFFPSAQNDQVVPEVKTSNDDKKWNSSPSSSSSSSSSL